MSRKLYILLFGLLILFGCGKGLVEVDESNYEPKIVFQAYLYPEKPVEGIVLQRNFPLNTTITRAELPLATATVTLRDVEAGQDYALSYDPNAGSFFYSGNDLQIGYGKAYRLSVSASIDGTQLEAHSTTITPESGFRIVEELSDLTPRKFFSRNDLGIVDSYDLMMEKSQDIGFYALSVKSEEADTANYIYNSPYAFAEEPADFEDEDINVESLIYNFTWVQDLEYGDGTFYFPIDWYMMSFYGRYRAILYAGDQNFRDYLITNGMVQEIDGNFHEPILHIEGDGIGVFGSAIADTVYFEVLR